jgi:hypothetical protein
MTELEKEGTRALIEKLAKDWKDEARAESERASGWSEKQQKERSYAQGKVAQLIVCANELTDKLLPSLVQEE